MDIKDSCSLAAYRVLQEAESPAGTELCQNIYNNKLYIKKILDSYDLSVYENLRDEPVKGMPLIAGLVEDGGRLTVIEAYVSGSTLRERLLEQGNFSQTEAQGIMLALCGIVEQLHGKSPAIIHRDIKPENILLMQDGGIVLLDVNAAKWYSPGEGRDTRLIGTSGYAAPEQYGFGSSDPRTDVYSMGVLYCELLTGRTPQAGLPGGAEGKIIEKCTRLKPEERYDDVKQLRTALRSVIKTAEETASEVRYKYPWQRFLPPGFRSLRIERVVGSIAGYWMMFTLSASMYINNTSPKGIRKNRIADIITLLAMILLCGDYLDIQKHLPIIKSKKPLVHGIGIILYCVIMIILLLVYSASLS